MQAFQLWHDDSFHALQQISGMDSFTLGYSSTRHSYLETTQSQDISKDVLVVDDDPHLCEIITDVLEAEGHTARTASNGQEALDRISERKPQLILLDLMMPVMNGWELAEALNASHEWSDIPIVFVTAAHSAMSRKPQEMGVKAIISKPFDIDMIVEAVQNYAV